MFKRKKSYLVVYYSKDKNDKLNIGNIVIDGIIEDWNDVRKVEELIKEVSNFKDVVVLNWKKF